MGCEKLGFNDPASKFGGASAKMGSMQGLEQSKQAEKVPPPQNLFAMQGANLQQGQLSQGQGSRFDATI